jgi:hypothetical protein
MSRVGQADGTGHACVYRPGRLKGDDSGPLVCAYVSLSVRLPARGHLCDCVYGRASGGGWGRRTVKLGRLAPGNAKAARRLAVVADNNAHICTHRSSPHIACTGASAGRPAAPPCLSLCLCGSVCVHLRFCVCICMCVHLCTSLSMSGYVRALGVGGPAYCRGRGGARCWAAWWQ